MKERSSTPAGAGAYTFPAVRQEGEKRRPSEEELAILGAMPDRQVRRLIERILRLGSPELALGVYGVHVRWRRSRGLPYLLPEEVGLREEGASEK